MSGLEDIQEKVELVYRKLNMDMEAHLVESVISLFSAGVLKHYVRSPRTRLDQSNFKMTVEAASGVRFAGREKIVELEQKIETLKRALRKYEEVRSFYAEPNKSRVNGLTTHTMYKGDIDTHESVGYVLKLKGKKARELEKDEDVIKAKAILEIKGEE